MIRKAIETIDVPTGDAPNPFANEQRNNEPYLEVYRVNSSDAMEVTKTLSVLFPGTVVNEDGSVSQDPRDGVQVRARGSLADDPQA